MLVNAREISTYCETIARTDRKNAQAARSTTRTKQAKLQATCTKRSAKKRVKNRQRAHNTSKREGKSRHLPATNAKPLRRMATSTWWRGHQSGGEAINLLGYPPWGLMVPVACNTNTKKFNSVHIRHGSSCRVVQPLAC